MRMNRLMIAHIGIAALACLAADGAAASGAGEARPDTEPEFVPASSDARTVNNAVRHAYRVLSDQEKASMQAIKDKGLELLELIDNIGGSRELSIAKTKTEEAVMWAVKHVTA